MIDGKSVPTVVPLRKGPKGVLGKTILPICSESLTTHRVNECVQIDISQPSERRGAIERMQGN